MLRFAAVALFTAAFLAAQTPRALMETKAREIRSATATLEQSIAVMGINQTMTGRVRFLAPELFRMDLAMTVGETKVSTLTVSNGKTLTIYTDLLGVAQTVDLARVRAVHEGWTGEAMAPGRPFKDFEPSSVAAMGEETVDGIPCLKFEARPLSDPSMARALPDLALARLWLGRDDGFPRRVAFLDKAGRELLSQRYTAVTVNSILDPAVFMVRLPEGVETVDATDLVLGTLKGKE